ncbi:MAG: C25 family cysteine peptidase, partial [Candidatus Electryoneaceae bacterium]|nr:C25 family cysteine peptidase [Candidatus Electryoneaceae bacterium]
GWNVWGGEYMDEVYESTNRWGYRTSGYPERYDDGRTDLYDMNSEWHPANDLAPLISEGHHFIHHLGHASTGYVMKFQSGVLNNNLISNDGVDNGFNIAWSQGCYPGAFDNRGTEPNQYGGDCIAEKFVSELDNGFVAFIANSRYGWGSGGNTNGASQHFHREFVDAIYDEDITIIGATNQDSKEDTAPWTESGVILWCYYEINLFGDPAMDIWTNEPEELQAEFENAVIINEETYEVLLDGIADAAVCLSRDGEIISATLTDEDGLAELDIPEPILPPGPVTLTIIAHDYLPFTDEIESIPSNQGFPWVEDLIFEDTGGIEDGQIDHGETIEIFPSVHNLGRRELTGLVVSLELDDPMVTIIRGETDYNMIDADDELQPDEPLVIEIDTTCADLHSIDFDLTFTDENEDSWSQPLSLISHAPVLDQYYLTILDEDGDNDGRLDPGEEAEIILSIVNNGTGRAVGISASFVAGNPLIEVLESEATIELLEPDEMMDFERRFIVRIDEDCPDPYRAIFHIRLRGERGLSTTHLLDMDIGGAIYNFDRDQEEWEHGNLEDEHVDQWHLSDEDNHTFDGSGCIKLGSEDPNTDYANMLNCAIYMPEFYVDGPLQLMFWHKIDAEDSRDYPGRCYDGGFLEASVDGEDWQLITPDGDGYPYTIRHGNAENPLPEDQPCYSGDHDWSLALFDLSRFEDSDVEIRFRFGSDGSDTCGGWWIDDIELLVRVDEMRPPDNFNGELTETGVLLTWDEPLFLRDDEFVNRLQGYRIYRCAENWDMLPELITDNLYYDRLIGFEDMEVLYMLTAEYTDGESQPSNLIYIDWEAPRNVNEEEDAIPDRWEITAAFPNPFNSSVRIGYSVPISGDVNIAVYDLNGRLVSELERGMHTPGRYAVTFEAEALPSGLYMVRMRTPVGDRTTRLVLIR